MFRWLKVIVAVVVTFVVIQALGFFAVRFGLTNVSGVVESDFSTTTRAAVVREKPKWSQGEEWTVFTAAMERDAADLKRAAALAEVSPRLIMAVVAVEQLRLYHSERELFQEVFAPLKLLGNQVQFSWGVAGIKQDTARQIEQHLKNQTSLYYLGPKLASRLDFTTTAADEERFNRLVNEEDHFYSYLYAGLFLKEMMVGWERAGFPINDRPEILATLYNIGFANSHPNQTPQVGGSSLEIGDQSYSFGGLAYEIYVSETLRSTFPQ